MVAAVLFLVAGVLTVNWAVRRVSDGRAADRAANDLQSPHRWPPVLLNHGSDAPAGADNGGRAVADGR